MDGARAGNAGGIAGLVAFLRAHGEALVGDFREIYGVSLRSEIPTTVGQRISLLALIRGLPPTSRVAAQIRGHEFWSVTDYLLASALDALNLANFIHGQGGKGQRPEPVERPKPAKPPKVGMDLEQYREWRAGMFEEASDG